MSHPVRIAFTASVGSHLDTASWIERAMRTETDGMTCTIIDLVGFGPWEAREIPYDGQCERVTFSLEACGLKSPIVDSTTWPTVLSGARTLIDEVGPDLLVTMDDSWYDQFALIRGAQHAGVPFLLAQEGPFRGGISSGRQPRGRITLRRSALLQSRLVRRLRGMPFPVRLPSYGRGGASLVLAASSWYKSRFVASGVSPKRVEVTGLPRYDAIPRVRQLWLERRNAGAAVRPPRVLLLSQPFLQYRVLSEAEYSSLAAIARSALAEVVARDGVTLEVRPHPSDRRQDMDILLGDYLAATLVASTTPLLKTLASYDVVVGFTSSGLLEAMAIGVPIVVIETPPIATQTRWFRDVGVPVATDAATAARLIRSALAGSESPELPSELIEEMGLLDGMASSRVAKQCLMSIARR